MKKIELYDFQRKAVRDVKKEFKEKNKILVTSPPGSGKTVMIAELARLAVNRKEKVLIIGQRREMLKQTYAHLLGVGAAEQHIGEIYPNSDRSLDLSKPIQIISAMTGLRRNLFPKADLVIMDEAHHIVAEGHARIISNYPKKDIVGFTATPIRMDGKGLGDVFDVLLTAAYPSDLIKDKKLAKPKSFSVPDEFLPDLTRIRRAMGDYVLPQLSERVNRKKLVGSIVGEYLKRAKDKTAICFATGLEHSKHIVNQFIAAGVPAEHLEGSMDAKERDGIVNRLREGETKVVSNVGILHEGFNLPKTYAVILARPTLSLALYLQQVGRALRRYGNINPLILDHARNVLRFGLPEADREFDLHNTVVVNVKQSTVKKCPECFVIISLGCKTCPECGYEFKAEPLIPEESKKSLEELTKTEKEKLKQRLEDYLEKKGEKDPVWIARVIEAWTAARSEFLNV